VLNGYNEIKLLENGHNGHETVVEAFAIAQRDVEVEAGVVVEEEVAEVEKDFKKPT
jgi:hypothetical protein